MSRARLLAVAFILSLTPAVARAGDDDAAPTELFNAGRDLMRDGDYAAACPKLAESVRLRPSVGALAKLAACEEHEHRLANAHARWLQALNLARSKSDPRTAEVEAEVQRIDRIVPKLLFSSATPLPANAAIHVDDFVFGPASLGVPLAVDPGKHAVLVSAEGKQDWSATVETRGDGATSLIAIPKLADATPIVPTPAAAPRAAPIAALSPAQRPLDTTRVVALSLGGAGVVVIGLGAVLAVSAIGKRSDAGCSGTVCPDDASAAKLTDAKRTATYSTVAFVVGGALALGGAALWLFAPSPSSDVRVGTALSPGGGGVVVRGRWD